MRFWMNLLLLLKMAMLFVMDIMRSWTSFEFGARRKRVYCRHGSEDAREVCDTFIKIRYNKIIGYYFEVSKLQLSIT